MSTLSALARSIVLALAVLPIAVAGSAQTYPNRPIRVVVPYPAGGSADLMPRALGPRMSEELGQQLVFENKPGASGTIGLGQVATARPDGYTLGATAPGSVTIFPHLQALAFDLLKDLAPAAIIDQLNAALQKALGYPDVQERLLQLGGDPAPGRSDVFARQLREDSEKYAKIIKDAGIKAD